MPTELSDTSHDRVSLEEAMQKDQRPMKIGSKRVKMAFKWVQTKGHIPGLDDENWQASQSDNIVDITGVTRARRLHREVHGQKIDQR